MQKKKTTKNPKHSKKTSYKNFNPIQEKFVKTGIRGLDDLMEVGIPKGSAILVAGGPGSGKTILCLQTLYNFLKMGKKCLYMSFEESGKNLKNHMKDFGWDISEFEKNGKVIIKNY